MIYLHRFLWTRSLMRGVLSQVEYWPMQGYLYCTERYKDMLYMFKLLKYRYMGDILYTTRSRILPGIW